MLASVLIPTRDRRDYLAVALRSIAPQAAELGAEVVVVQDAPADPAVEELARTHGALFVAHGETRGPNAARNTAIGAARGELLVFVDDDIEAWPGWLAALVGAADALPGHEAFGGPIRPRLEGIDVHWCGREDLPITTLDHGAEDRDVELAWSANLAIRRSALDRIGPFDATLAVRQAPSRGAATTYGDEEQWQRRLAAGGGRVRYVAAAGVDHRRAGADATWRALARAAWFRGRMAREYDLRKGTAPSLPAELRTLAGSIAHIARRRCGNGVLLTAMSAGRLREAVAPRPAPPTGPDYLSGHSGTLSRRGLVFGAARDAIAELYGAPLRVALWSAARTAPRRRVLTLCVTRPARSAVAAAARSELERSRHDVEVWLVEPAADRGRWANINAALRDEPLGDRDWLVVFDDDVVLPRGFLDVFLLCAERLGLRMAQPAHAYRSHAAWPVTRRRPWLAARSTRFVEQGPVLALDAGAVARLQPFPDLQMGWGIDTHWSAVAAAEGWPIGVVDATPIRHLHPVATAYAGDAAAAEAAAFLDGRPYVGREPAALTVTAHRWPRTGS
jgi:GT2 family glycosyltransferase